MLRLSMLLFILLSACAKAPVKQPELEKKFFSDVKGCFLLFNLKTQKFEHEIGGKSCRKRFPACSTFKVPLAVMAFDAGVLKDQTQMLKWDGKKQWLDAWNNDHNAKSWMRESVVWFSQRLTPKIGAKKLQNYLNKFEYGNRDLKGGLTQAWLNPPTNPVGLKISAYEQVEFMKKLWTDKLPASPLAQKITRELTYLELSPKRFQLYGKTGSNYYDKASNSQLGWFISRLSNGESEYIAVTNLSDLAPYKGDSFGGPRAREITKNILAELGLW